MKVNLQSKIQHQRVLNILLLRDQFILKLHLNNTI
jgi:hypothetical protein